MAAMKLTTAPTRPWCVLVPVKRLDLAKSRLAAVAGPLRGDLALAVAADTVSAALGCSVVRRVVAVTDDARARVELSALGALVIADEPDAGLNPALAHAAQQVRAADPQCVVAALSADLPALRPAELAVALSDALLHPRSFVADAAGVGTTLLAALSGVALDPRFGVRSRQRHASSGGFELTGTAYPTVRRDVDTEADLWDAVRLGVGPRTRSVADTLRGTPSSN
ncbi:2-phospho-L-lactate guanylyltransferase [soil metagenome]